MKPPARVAEALARVRAQNDLVLHAFDLGYRCGEGDGRRGALGNVERVIELGGDLFDVADAVGVLANVDVLMDEIRDYFNHLDGQR